MISDKRKDLLYRIKLAIDRLHEALEEADRDSFEGADMSLSFAEVFIKRARIQLKDEGR